MAKTRGGNRKVTKLALQMALLWCYLKYGRSIWQLEPVTIALRSNIEAYGRYKHFTVYNKKTGDCFGDHAYIIVNPQKHKTLRKAVETVIHEYTHHLQRIDTYESYFNKGYDYDNHPLEKEAFLVSQRDAAECTKWVLSKLKSDQNG